MYTYNSILPTYYIYHHKATYYPLLYDSIPQAYPPSYPSIVLSIAQEQAGLTLRDKSA